MSSLDDDLIDLERIVINLRGLRVDTAAVESRLADLRRCSTAVLVDGVNKLSRLLTAISSAVDCEREHEAVLKWMKDAENQLQALDSDRNLSVEDKIQQQEVLVDI